MRRHRLPNGRDIYLVRLALAGTYEGHLEGTPERISAAILQSLPKQAARLLGPATPLAVVPPPAGPLPGWLCVAELESRSGAQTTDADYRSRLFVCWFTDDTGQSIDAMIEAVLPHLDWEAAADDYNVMDF